MALKATALKLDNKPGKVRIRIIKDDTTQASIRMKASEAVEFATSLLTVANDALKVELASGSSRPPSASEGGDDGDGY